MTYEEVELIVLAKNNADAFSQAKKVLRTADLQVLKPVRLEPDPGGGYQGWAVRIRLYTLSRYQVVEQEEDETDLKHQG